MNKVAVVSLITVSAALVLGVSVLEGVTIAGTHSANPLNIKTRSDFQNLTDNKKILDIKNFKSVQSFVNAKGRGTLVAKKIGKIDDLEFKYYGSGETVDLKKDDIIFRDWRAVREYMARCDKVSVEEPTEPTKSAEPTQSAEPIENVQPVEEQTQGSEPVVHEKYQMSDEIKQVLDSFGMKPEELDDVLHTFWNAKECFRKTQAFARLGGAFEDICPVLGEQSEAAMKEKFFSGKHWEILRVGVVMTVGGKNFPNPIVGCYKWICGLRDAGYSLEEIGNEPSDVIVSRIRRFVEIFYRLTGTEKRVNELLAKKDNDSKHAYNPSEYW